MPEFPLPNLEELIFDAVVQKFFEPTITYQTQVQYNPQTGISVPTIVPSVDESPLMQVARRMYENNRDQLADAIGERIEINKIADLIYEQFMQSLGGNGYAITNSAFMKSVEAQVKENVVAEMTSRAITKMDEDSPQVPQGVSGIVQPVGNPHNIHGTDCSPDCCF